MKRRNHRRAQSVAAAAALVLPNFARAADFSWTFDGGGTSWTNTWTIASNWVPNSVPNASSSDLTFLASGVLGGAGTVIVNGTLAEGTLHFNSSGAFGYSLDGTGGGTLTFPANGTIDVSTSSTATISSGLQLRATSGLTKVGGGTLLVSSNGTYTGTTTITAGTLAVTGAATLGTGTIILNGGALAQVGSISANISAPINVQAAGGTIAFQDSNTAEQLNSSLSGTGTLFLAKDAPLFTANATWQNFAGTLDFSQSIGTVRLNLTQNLNYGASNAFWNLGNNGVTLTARQGNVTGAGFNIGALTGGPNATFTGANNGTGNTTTWIIGGLNLSTTFAGAFWDADGAARTSGITKTGTGTLTLTGTSNSTGAININQGRLVIAEQGNFAGNPFDSSLKQNIIVNNGATLAVADSGTFTGPQNIILHNGVFDVSGANGGYTNSPSVTLIGTNQSNDTGFVRGAYTHAAGTISPGDLGVPGTVTFGSPTSPTSVILNGGDILMDVNSTLALGGGTNDLLVVNGDLNIPSTTTFRINSNGDDIPLLFWQEAPIIRYTGSLTASLSFLSHVTSPERRFMVLENHPAVGGGGTLTIKEIGEFIEPANITWTGAASNVWDLNITSNFSTGGSPVTFFQLDSVVMNDSALGSSINLVGAKIKPASLTINNNTKDYTFVGTGAITGSVGLVKTGTGQLTIRNANTYTGGSTISGGRVQLGVDGGGTTATFLGTGSVYLSNATLSVSNNVTSNNLVVPVGSSSTLVFSNTGNTASGNWAGAFHGGGTINLLSNGNNNGTGSVNINADNRDFNGTVNVWIDPAFPSGVFNVRGQNQYFAANQVWNLPDTAAENLFILSILDQWAFEVGVGGLSGNGELYSQATSGASATGARSTRWRIGDRGVDTTFSGSINDNLSAPAQGPSGLIKSGAGSLTLTGTGLIYSGDTTVRGGTLVADGIAGGSLAGNLQKTNLVEVGGGTFLVRNGAQITKATFKAAPDDITAGVVFSANAGGHFDLTQAYNYAVGGPGANRFQLPPGLTISGDGGTVHGVLQLGNVAGGTTTLGTNPTGAGTINPGAQGLGKIGTLSFEELHVGTGGTLAFDLATATTTGGGVNDLLTTSGTLELGGGTLVANFTGAVNAGSTYRLMNAGNLLSGASFSNVIVNARLTGPNWSVNPVTGAGGGVDLVVNESSQGNSLKWQPSNTTPSNPAFMVANTWDTNIGRNWRNLTNLALTADFFYPTDAVTFDDVQQTVTGGTANDGTVVLVAPVFPESVTVNPGSGKGYTFAGTTFSGTSSGPTDRLHSTAGRISGTASLTKTGAGSLVILTNNDYTGATVISSGTLQVGDDASRPVSTSRHDQAIFGSLGSGLVTIANGATLIFARRDAYVVANSISGQGTLYKVNGSSIRLDGSNSYTGNTVIGGGEIRLGNDSAIPANSDVILSLTPNPATSSGAIGGKLNLFGHDLILNSLISTGSFNTGAPGSASLGLVTNQDNDAVTRTTTLAIATANFNGVISGNLNLVKNSTGVATMTYQSSVGTAASTYTGTTSINQGTLQILANGNAITHQGNASSTYSVASGAALAGAGTIIAPINISSGGIVAPGVFGGTTTTQVGTLALATLSLNSSIVNLDINGGAMDRIILTDTNGANTNGFSSLSGVSTINLANIGAGFIATGSYPVIDYAGTPLADLSHFALGTLVNISAPYQVSLLNDQTNTSINLKISNLVNATWAVATGGSWEVPSNWSSTPGGQYPDGTDSQATFGNIIGQPANISITAPRTLGGMTFDSAQPYSITSSNSSATLIFDASAVAATAAVSSGSHTIAVPVASQDALLIDVAASSRLTLTKSLNVGDGISGKSLTKSGLGTLQVEHVRTTVGNDGISTLTVSTGRLVVSQKTAGNNDPGGTSRVNSLSIGAGAVLDLTNNSMVIDYNTGAGIGSLLSDLRQMLSDGRLITTAPPPGAGRDVRLGYKDNANTAGAGNAKVLTLAGQSVDSSSVLIKFTFGGDTNLDGKVDISDLANLAVHFNQSGVWQDGDFDYDGMVNSVDLGLLAADWQAGVGDGAALGASLDGLLGGLPGSSVPEPGCLVWIGPLVGLARRQRHRHSRQPE